MSTWSIARCQFVPQNTTWFDWLGDVKINDGSINEQEWGELVVEILRKVIGFEELEGEMGLRQSAMVDILDRLSSYHIMTIRDGSARRTRRVEIPNTMIYDLGYRFHSKVDIESGLFFLERHKASKQYYAWDAEAGLEVDNRSRTRMSRIIETGSTVQDHSQHVMSRDITGKNSFFTNNTED